jgi:Acetyltransferase (GNAT) domain
MIYRIDPTKDARWTEFVKRHPKASVFHSVGWLQALGSTYGYEPVVFTTSPPTEALKNGLVFCRVDSFITGRRLVSLPFSDHCEPLCDSNEESDNLICNFQAALKNQKVKYVEVRPADDTFSQTLEKNKFQPVTKYYLHILSLTPDLPELFRGLDKDSVQRRIRRADHASLVEQCGRSEGLLKDFYGLFTLTRSRHQVPPTPFAWFRNLVLCQGEALEIRVAYKNETPISAILTIQFKDTVYYKYGCSDARFNQFGATPWLFWKAIVAAKTRNATKFDFGRTEEDNPGLLAFKNHWAPHPRSLIYWRYPDGSSLASVTGWKLRMAKRVFSCLPHRILNIVGNLVYRHIG